MKTCSIGGSPSTFFSGHFQTDFAYQGALNKDATIWLERARPPPPRPPHQKKVLVLLQSRSLTSTVTRWKKCQFKIALNSIRFKNSCFNEKKCIYSSMGLYHPLDGITKPKYKLLYFLTPNKNISKRKALAFNRDRCCHLAICLWLILFHCTELPSISPFF